MTKITQYDRPKTRGDLKTLLQHGFACEVVSSNAEITNIFLDGWLKMEGYYKTRPSENEGWTVYEPITKNPSSTDD